VSREPLAAHHLSHRGLLRPTLEHGGGAVSAIVVPASRPAAYLLPAMEVATDLGCEFVALCSGRCRIKEAARLAAEMPGLAWTLVDLPAGWTSRLVDFRTAEVPAATATRVGDLSLKRNIGLLLAQLAGWRGVLFLDDDIRDLSPRTVRRAASALRPGWATGMIAEEFPDNSVVCHALRLSGRPQQVFVSGSALAVDTTTVDSFFPAVYNEDWLFFYNRVRAQRVSATGVVRQAPYRPYADPERAKREEFGDLLAEGLMSFLHAQTKVSRALDRSYWAQAIDQRAELLEGITTRLTGVDDRDAAPAMAAVQAARKELESFQADVLAAYVGLWRADLRDWTRWLAGLSREHSLEAALDRLCLPSMGPRRPRAQLTGRVRRSSQRLGSRFSGWRSPIGLNPSLR
jgi:hypothetical protein